MLIFGIISSCRASILSRSLLDPQPLIRQSSPKGNTLPPQEQPLVNTTNIQSYPIQDLPMRDDDDIVKMREEEQNNFFTNYKASGTGKMNLEKSPLNKITSQTEQNEMLKQKQEDSRNQNPGTCTAQYLEEKWTTIACHTLSVCIVLNLGLVRIRYGVSHQGYILGLILFSRSAPTGRSWAQPLTGEVTHCLREPHSRVDQIKPHPHVLLMMMANHKSLAHHMARSEPPLLFTVVESKPKNPQTLRATTDFYRLSSVGNLLYQGSAISLTAPGTVKDVCSVIVLSRTICIYEEMTKATYENITTPQPIRRK
ncbi:hypothetical protein V8G54_033191 [Vigna mungo]|uniref:Uncharacterized protein n=1 Tax=Vigna mungo TaxID=3915 RepID=A0AAQ3MNK5_VIGMU